MAISPCGVTTNAQGMELEQHGTALFPIACYHNDLRKDPVPWHWHADLEAAVVTEGSVVVAIGPERMLLHPGQGFFVNPGVLHGETHGPYGCRLHSTVFHPRLIGGSMDSIFWQKYVQPLLDAGAGKGVFLDNSAPWHREAVRVLEDAWNTCAQEPPGYELRMRDDMSQLLFLLSGYFCGAEEAPLPEKALRREERVKTMLRFIQERYGEELTTRMIAQSAMISESECLRCFRATIGVPPIQYLKQFRIQKAAELLRSTQERAAEIGARCGFQDASYFTKTFREQMGCTPSAYREQP